MQVRLFVLLVALMTIALSSLGVPLPGVVQDGAQGITAPAHYRPATCCAVAGCSARTRSPTTSTVVDAEVGSGDVVLLGMSVQHRAEAHGTYKLLFNSVYLAGEK